MITDAHGCAYSWTTATQKSQERHRPLSPSLSFLELGDVVLDSGNLTHSVKTTKELEFCVVSRPSDGRWRSLDNGNTEPAVIESLGESVWLRF